MPPVILDLMSSEVQALPRATRDPSVTPSPQHFAGRFTDVGLQTLLPPEEIIFTEDSPRLASLSSLEDVLWLQEGQHMQRQLQDEFEVTLIILWRGKTQVWCVFKTVQNLSDH